MKKIIYLPMDERPCNASFPVLLYGDALRISTPETLGAKKKPASWPALKDFLRREAADADGLVLSMDQLLYGGLIPSRLHHLEEGEVTERLAFLRELRAANPSLTVYAYQCIMRCPGYSDSDEEPDYYADCGREIFLLGDALHRARLGLCRPEEADRFREQVPEEALRDYLDRRAFNLRFNLASLQLVQDGVIDFLVFPQDDAARYGFTAMDQEKVRKRIGELRLGTRVFMYPGADELGLVITTRMLLHFTGKRPKIYVRTAATNAVFEIPPYEDRPLGETIKYHVTAAGCRLVTCMSEADIVLGVSFPGHGGRPDSADQDPDQGYSVERNLIEFVYFLQDAADDGKIVSLADNAYANGSDRELLSLLDQMGLLNRLHGYSGWNTSSNTMGTAIACGVHALLFGMTPAHRDFLALRYLEDAGYGSWVRHRVTRDVLPKMNYSYYFVGEQRGEVSRIIREQLEAFAREYMPSICERLEIQDVWMPWTRMFEIGMKVHWKQD